MTTVRYDSPSARRHPRVTAPAWVTLDGKRYATLDWCIGGFRLAEYAGDVAVGDQLAVRFFVNFQGFEIGFDAQVKVRGLAREAHELSAEFLELGPRESELLRHFVVGVSTGEVSSVSDTLVHMDTPTSVANWGQAPGASEPASAKDRRNTRTLWRTSLYFVAGPLVAIYAILAVYGTVFRMDLETAVVVRPTETVVAQGVGHMDRLLVREGQTVTAGQPLFTMVDEDHGRDLDAKRFDVASARVELKSAESSRHSADEQLQIYKSIALHKQRIAVERVNALTIETESAEKELARVESLVRAGMEPSSDLDAANAVFAKVKGQLSEAKPELELANDAVRAAEHGSFYDGFRLVGELPDQIIREEAARSRARIADERLAAAQGSSGQSTYTISFPGRVVRLAKSAGSTVNRGETLALIERVQETPKIYALLTQDQVARIQLGEKAVVRIPTLRQRFQAVVVRSDKTLASSGGALNDLLANPARPRSGELTGFVELELRPLSAAARTALWSGMPAIVNLPRQPMRSPGQGLSSWLPQ